mmetsp:Transcript_91482/g.272983  ORF Transcript_91482/g.272983 Transcript_91482/m.272983 type:complete len:135 (-) Transcript_91482:78-482(-)
MIINSRALENLEVRGAEYPPPADKVMFAKLASYLQMGTFGLIFFGEKLFSAANMPVPAIFATAKENMFASFMFVWMVGNMVQSSLLSTGAFEIHHGDKLIWSSLEEKRLPNMEDLIKAFQKTGVEFLSAQEDAK